MPPLNTHSLFLLPFLEKPIYNLRTPVRRNSAKPSNQTLVADDDDETNISNDTPIHSDNFRHYEACDIKRTSKQLLDNGNLGTSRPTLFRILKGQFVLLRPHDNSYRPAVAKVISFFSDKSSNAQLVRVQWFYRGEDLCDKSPESVGEDEVFETHHFDNIEVDCIAGRCTVTSYPQWLTSCASESVDRPNALAIAHSGQNNPNPSTNLPNASSSTPTIVPNGSHADNVTLIPPALPDVDKDDDDDDDAKSHFWENYRESSVRYYCRHFYDPAMHIFVNTKYECQDADPQEEIAIYRSMRGARDEDADYQAEDPSSESDGEPAYITDDELAELKPARATRSLAKRPPSSRQAGKKKRTPKEAQFALPVQLDCAETLPCRDEQKARVRAFLLDVIADNDGDRTQGSRCLYISGVPGTGKTATVREVLRDLRGLRGNGTVDEFETVEVNAMTLSDPALVYSELYTAVTGHHGVAPMHAAQLLEKRFADCVGGGAAKGKRGRAGVGAGRGGGGCVIVMLDEMDVLLARKQKVLYDLLEWPSRRNARLAVIGIANTMDLPERMLPRLASRIGLNRLCYPPYTRTQIMEILKLTLDQSEVKFDDGALRLCATKVGAVSGDVRRAFELCRRASEIMTETKAVETKATGADRVVMAPHVNAAIQDVAGNARLATLTQLALFEKLVLVSALYMARSEGAYDMESMCSMEAVCEKALDFAKGHPKVFCECEPTTFELQEACWRLAGQRIVLIEKAIVPRLSRVIVNLSADDCAFGLRDCEFSTSILKGQGAVR